MVGCGHTMSAGKNMQQYVNYYYNKSLAKDGYKEELFVEDTEKINTEKDCAERLERRWKPLWPFEM